MKLFNGMKLRNALRLAKQNGAEVSKPNATGEVSCKAPTMQKRALVSNHKKDAPRSLVTWLRRLLDGGDCDGSRCGSCARSDFCRVGFAT